MKHFIVPQIYIQRYKTVAKLSTIVQIKLNNFIEGNSIKLLPFASNGETYK